MGGDAGQGGQDGDRRTDPDVGRAVLQDLTFLEPVAPPA